MLIGQISRGYRAYLLSLATAAFNRERNTPDNPRSLFRATRTPRITRHEAITIYRPFKDVRFGDIDWTASRDNRAPAFTDKTKEG